MSWQLHKNSQKRKESREEGVKERRKETCRTQMSGWKQRCKKRVKNAFVCKVCATSALTQEKLEPPHQNEKKKRVRGEIRGWHKNGRRLQYKKIN